MSEQADGYIIINSEIDPSGFESDSQKLQNAIKSLNNKVASMGTTFQKAVLGNAASVQSFESKTAVLQQTISDIESKMQELGKRKVPTEMFAVLCEDAEEAKKKAAECAKEIEKLDKQYDKDENGLSGYYKEKAAIEQSTKELLGKSDVSQKGAVLEIEAAQLEQLNEKYQEKLDTIREIGAALDEQKRKQADYIALANSLAESANSEYQMGADTEEYAQLNGELDAAKNSLSEMQAEVGKATMHTQGLLSVMRNAPPLTEQIKNGFEAIKSKIKSIGQALKSAGAATKNTFLHPLQTMNQAAGSATAAVRGIAQKGIRGLKSFGKSVLNNVKNLKLFKKSSAGAGNGVGNLGKKLLSIGGMMKRMITRKAISAMFTGAKEGMDNLAQYSGTTNKSLSALKSSLTQLKNSFATAFAPLINAVMPILTKFIGHISAAATYIGKLFASLTGAKTFTKATAVQEDYAASLDKTGKNAKKAQKSLLGMDEINALSDNSDSGNDAGSVSPSDMFTDVPIESEITAFTERIKEAFRSGNFSEIGQILGDSINGVLETIRSKIQWDTVGEKVTQTVKGIADGFNGLIHSVQWETLGDTVAQGLNTVLNTLYLLITEFDWAGTAAAFARSLNGLVTGFDWAKLGETFSKMITTALGMLRTAITTFDWKNLGNSIADFINNIDWVSIISDLTGLLSDILVSAGDLLVGFADGLDWGKLSSDLWNSLVGIITNIDWGALIANAFHLLGSAIGGSIVMIGEFYATMWDMLKQGYENTKSYFNEYIEEAGGNLIAGLWNGITDALKNVGTWIMDNIVTPFVDGLRNAFGIHSPSTVMAEQGGFIISGLKNGITSAWSNITTFFSNAVSGIKTTLSNGWDRVKSTTSNAWQNIKSTATTKMTEMGNSISTSFTNLKSKASTWGKDLCENMADGIRKAKDRVKNAATSVADSIKSILGFSEPEKGPLSDFHTYMPDMLDLMAYGIRKNQSKAVNAVSEVAKAIQSEVQDCKPILQFSAQADKNPLSDFSSAVVHDFSNMLDRLQSIANRVKFTIPIAAEGGLIPYAVSASNARQTSVHQASADTINEFTQSIESANRAQNELLREQNSLLRQLLQKESHVQAIVSTSDIQSGFVRKNRRDGSVTLPVGG